MESFIIAEISAGGGRLALCPMPGRGGDYVGDLARIVAWEPSLVLTMATRDEMAAHGAASLGADLVLRGVGWRHLPVPDYQADSAELRAGWAGASRAALDHLAAGRGVLALCLGGCGRSGMAVMRLMVEAGEDPATALARLRSVRDCAVEKDPQYDWAARGAQNRA
jgi:protein-tyrosine phosphatase